MKIFRLAQTFSIQLILQADISVPDVMPQGEPIGIDLGLEKFLAVSTGELIERPSLFHGFAHQASMAATQIEKQAYWVC